MDYRTMGRTGLQVSAIGLGCRMFGRSVDEASTGAIVDSALGLGVTFIDTAESYGDGQSEIALGKALIGRRHKVILATKTGRRLEPGSEAGGRLTRKRIVERLEASLQRLGTDFVDLYYFHFPDPLTPLDESLRAVDDLVRAGKIRYHGCSNYPAWQIAEMAEIADRRGYTATAVCQMAYNMLERSVEHEVIPACVHYGMSLVPYHPLASGFLTGKHGRGSTPSGTLARSLRLGDRVPEEASYDALDRWRQFAADRGHTVGELAIAWLLAKPVVASVIAGSTSVDQLKDNAAAADWALTTDDVEELEQGPSER